MQFLYRIPIALAVLTLTGVPADAADSSLSNRLATVSPAESATRATISTWKPLFVGIEGCTGTSKQPRPLQVHAVRIVLHEPSVDFLVTPPNGEAPLEVNARTTSDFLREFKCQVAINGAVFAPFAKSNLAPMDIEGLAVSRGVAYSAANQHHSLVITTNHQARIARTPDGGAGGFNILSGFYSVLQDGTNTGSHKDLHPRSAAGISGDGRWLILMVADGRQPGFSEGLSTAETGEWMRRLGAHNALNLDGGGSTALVIQDSKGASRLLNRPSGPPPGTERRVGNHLGVFVRPLAP